MIKNAANISETLEARINLIDNLGMVTIVFNKPIRIPSNYQNFSYNEMSISVKPSSYEDADMKNFEI